MQDVAAYGTVSATDDLKSMTISRRSPEATDVDIEVLYCGVCHSDLHSARNDWGYSRYPLVPGHEIIGRVVRVGTEVSRYSAGDLVAVGCLVDSCRSCSSCEEDLEQYCDGGLVGTYGSNDQRHGGAMTYGGYSERIVVEQRFVLKVPENLDAKAAAPLLCAGITTWSPLRHWKIGKGDTVGIIGLGGLGHMGVKFAHALGAKVVMITSSPSKAEDARRLGADSVLISGDAEAMKNADSSFDFLLNTIPVEHDINPYISLLKRDGTMVIVGALVPLHDALQAGPLVMKRRRIAGSIIGGLKETQEMLDFCGEHNIVSEIEMIDMQTINQAYERMLKNDVKYRFVIDMATLS
ncbi:MAG: NAD(P)-dependent alcohol dehydrogenase [Spongiibacteraceae bacterium]